MSRTTLPIFLVFAAVSLCYAPISIATEVSEPQHSRVQRLLLTSNCLTDTTYGVSAYLAPLIPGVIDSVVGSIVGAVKKAGDDSTKTVVVNESDFFYVLNTQKKLFEPKYKCLTIIIGSTKDDPKRSAPQAGGDDGAFKNAIQAIANGYSDYAAEIDLLAELRVENAPDNTTFRLVANSLYIGKYIHKARSDRARNYLVTVDLRRPNTEDGKAYVSIALPVLTGAEHESYFGATTLHEMGIRSRWVPYPPLSDAVKAQLAAYKELLNAEQELTARNRKRKACAGANQPTDACLKATYPDIADVNSDLSELRAMHQEKQRRAKALADAKFADLKSTGQAVHRLNETESEIEAYISVLISAAKLECKKRDAREMQQCLGANPVGDAPVCSGPASRKCVFDAGTGGAEFMEWSAALTETRPGSPFMKKLGEILDSGKSGISDEFKGKFDPATIAEQAKTDETARKERVSSLDTLRIKQQEVQLKTLELASATSESQRLKIEFEIINKKHEANELARQLGIPLPYDDL